MGLNTEEKKIIELLRENSIAANTMSADNGVFVMTAIGTKTGEYKGIFIPVTATISTIYVDEIASNVATTYIDVPATALEAGVYITPAKGSRFTSVTTTAGSVVLLNK